MVETAKYHRHKERVAAREVTESQKGREIAPIPPIANIRRRSRCCKSLRLFCETYNPTAFSMGWSEGHLRAISRIEEATRHGALYAFAMPRGSGKTTIVRMAALWAVANCLRRYVFAIGANAAKAQDSLAAIKTFVRFLPEFAADYPELSYPVQRLGGIANRASGQICHGKSTMIQWSQDCIVLPTVPPPANWPRSWRLREDGMVPTSGSVISASGLTGDGIRGSVLTLTTGESIRPDLVLLDDPQTKESATSPAQNASREELISGDVLGMAGPGKSISAVMPCTVIEQGDMIDRILDRSKHPLWRGTREKLLESMPTDLDEWEKYFEVYRACAVKEPPDFGDSNAHYLTNRQLLDAGAVASWPARKLDWEVSAIQHAMHLYCRDRRAFFAEFQNTPEPRVQADRSMLTAAEIAARVNQVNRLEIPVNAAHVTGFIDVQKDVLFYVLCAWESDFTGFVVDYGAFPDQGRAYFTLRDARKTLGKVTGADGAEAAIYAGLTTLTATLCNQEWRRENCTGTMLLGKLLIDANWGEMTDLVYRFCRQDCHKALLLPSHGKGLTAANKPMSDWQLTAGSQRGSNLVVSPAKRGFRKVVFDSNYWKSFVHSRLAAGMGAKGAMTLFGDRPEQHRLFADHLTAESRVETQGQGRTVDQWANVKKQDNHWFDCLVGCAVAASILGVALSSSGEEPPQAAKRVSFAELQAQAKGKMGAR
jgi:hypothetical protein